MASNFQHFKLQVSDSCQKNDLIDNLYSLVATSGREKKSLGNKSYLLGN